MLQSLWKALELQPEKHSKLTQWATVSVVLHLLALALLFGVRTGAVHTVRVNSDLMRDRPVVIVPFVSAAQKKKNQSRSQLMKSSAQPAKKTVSSKQSTQARTVLLKQKQKADSVKPPEKKAAKAVAKPEKPKEPVQQKQQIAEEKKVVNAPLLPQEVQEPVQEPLYVAQTEVEQFEIEMIVQQTVAEVWCKPAGLASGASCKVRVTVDAAGKVVDVYDEQPSGIVMFDAAVYLALEQVQFPQRIAGKTVSIIFS